MSKSEKFGISATIYRRKQQAALDLRTIEADMLQYLADKYHLELMLTAEESLKPNTVYLKLDGDKIRYKILGNKSEIHEGMIAKEDLDSRSAPKKDNLEAFNRIKPSILIAISKKSHIEALNSKRDPALSLSFIIDALVFLYGCVTLAPAFMVIVYDRLMLLLFPNLFLEKIEDGTDTTTGRTKSPPLPSEPTKKESKADMLAQIMALTKHNKYHLELMSTLTAEESLKPNTVYLKLDEDDGLQYKILGNNSEIHEGMIAKEELGKYSKLKEDNLKVFKIMKKSILAAIFKKLDIRSANQKLVEIAKMLRQPKASSSSRVS